MRRSGAPAPDCARPARRRAGRLARALPPGPVGPFDRANAILLDCPEGAFAAASRTAVLNGANVLAVRASDGWEIVQFSDADEIAPGRWELATLLRARLGTDHAMRSGAPVGADVVLLGSAVAPVELDASERGEGVRWIVGPAAAPLDPTRVATIDATAGVRSETLPSPVHLRVERRAGGIVLRWTRRTRIGGERWDAEDVPLGEERERYRVRLSAGQLSRTIEVDRPELAVPPDLAGSPGPVVASVAQVGVREGEAAEIAIR